MWQPIKFISELEPIIPVSSLLELTLSKAIMQLYVIVQTFQGLRLHFNFSFKTKRISYFQASKPFNFRRRLPVSDYVYVCEFSYVI